MDYLKGSAMKEKVQTVILLPREDQDKAVAALHGDELMNFIKELVILGQASGYDIGMLSIVDKLGGEDGQKRLHVRKLLRKFPEVPSVALALDREFADQRDRMFAIIDDVNYNRLPASRYHELLHENLREGGDFEGDPIITRTFLTFALGKVTDKQQFLKSFKSAFGAHQFEMYFNTPNYIDKGVRVTLGELYFDNYGSFNLEERQSLTKKERILLGNYLKAGDSVDINNIDIHNISSNKSADESHIAAFQFMLAAESLEVIANYPSTAKVMLTERGKLDVFVAGKIKSLKDTLYAMASMDNAQLFAQYVCHTLENSYKGIEYDKLDARNKQNVDGFRFQLLAAQRYVDDMLNHRCEGGDYPYETNVSTENGLTMEEMLATAYWATTDRANFRNEQVTPEGNLVQLVKQLYDIRRGYDIDAGTDQSEASPPVFPENPTTDQNRCLCGSINSLPWGLASTHRQYNPKYISRASLERELKNIYMKLVGEEIAEFQKSENKDALRIWNLNGKITGQIAEKLRMRFDQENRVKFVESYKGYVDDQLFQEVINNGLNKIPVPEVLKLPIESMSREDIYDAIVDNKLPLLHLDPEKGCETALNYLQAMASNRGLIKFLFGRAQGEHKQSIKRRVMFFLSRGNLTPEQKNLAVMSVKEKTITISDIGTLTVHEYIKICKMVEKEKKDDLLAVSIANQHTGLFVLYARKFGLTPEELTTEFGPNGQTPLLYAASINRPDIIRATLEMVNGNGETPLQVAVYNGNSVAVKAIWDAAPELFLSQLEVIGRRRKTLLHFALSEGTKDVAEVILMTIQGKQDIRKRLLETSNFYGTSFLQTIGNPGILKMVLDCNKDFPELLRDQLDFKGVFEQTILHKVADSDDIDALKALLEAANGCPGQLEIQLFERDGQGKTVLERAVSKGKIEAVRTIVEFVQRVSPGLLDSLLKMKIGKGQTLYDKANAENQNGIAFLLFIHGAKSGKSGPCPQLPLGSPAKRQRPEKEDTPTNCTDLFEAFNLSPSMPPIDACFLSGAEKMLAQASQAKTPSPAKKPRGENDEGYSPAKQLLYVTTLTQLMDAAFLSSSALPVIADNPAEEGAQVSHAKTSSPNKRLRSEDVEGLGSDGKCAAR